MPTESEWEYAARAGTTTGTYNGTSELTNCAEPNTVLDPIAWFCGNAGTVTFAVKGKQANAWGLFDMLGNVWEWVWDWYGAYPTGTVTDPTGSSTGTDRVERGGAWADGARATRAANRNYFVPVTHASKLGFRPSVSMP